MVIAKLYHIDIKWNMKCANKVTNRRTLGKRWYLVAVF